jgi:hypothetical protein
MNQWIGQHKENKMLPRKAIGKRMGSKASDSRMIRISVTPTAYEAIWSTLPPGRGPWPVERQGGYAGRRQFKLRRDKDTWAKRHEFNLHVTTRQDKPSRLRAKPDKQGPSHRRAGEAIGLAVITADQGVGVGLHQRFGPLSASAPSQHYHLYESPESLQHSGPQVSPGLFS